MCNIQVLELALGNKMDVLAIDKPGSDKYDMGVLFSKYLY